jgi:hypothetical protein
MSRAADQPARCTVQSADKLPAESGGVEALCAEIEAATAQLRPLPTVAVRIASAHFLAATVTVAGRELPEIKMSRSDRVVDRSAFKRFAQAIANAAASAPRE